MRQSARAHAVAHASWNLHRMFRNNFNVERSGNARGEAAASPRALVDKEHTFFLFKYYYFAQTENALALLRI
eukprot:6430859-Pyramimonas_sp.AAC.1